MEQAEPQFRDNSILMGNPFPGYFLIVLLIGTMILGNLLSNLFIILMDTATGFDSQDLILHSNINDAADRNYVRLISGVGHLLTFLIPAIITVQFVYRQAWSQEMKLDRTPALNNLFLSGLFALFSFPLVQLTYLLNKEIPIPQWAQTMETNANELIEALTIMNGSGELLVNLLVISLIPAIGEELVFRGILQQKLNEYFKKEWLAIWITALLFSAFHFQFEGFLPRMFLGACLGYLFYWTNNLWVPIAAHAVVNGSQILGKYFLNQELEDVGVDPNFQSFIPITIIATIIFIGLGYLLIKLNAGKDNQTIHPTP